MATPWWLTTKYNFDPEQGSSQTYYDATTGRQVYQQGGKYYYNLPTEDRYVTGEDGQWQKIAGNAGEAMPTMPNAPDLATVLGASGVNGAARIRLADGTETMGTALNSDAGDYSKLFEGMVPGANGYLQESGQGAPKMRIVRGSDGNMYAAAPSAAKFNQVQPDNAGFSNMFTSSFLPFAMPYLSSALGIPSLTDLISKLGGAAEPFVGGGMASFGEQSAINNALTDSALGGGLEGIASAAPVAESFPVTAPETIPSTPLSAASNYQYTVSDPAITAADATVNITPNISTDTPITNAVPNTTQGTAGMEDWNWEDLTKLLQEQAAPTVPTTTDASGWTSGYDVPTVPTATPDYGDLGMAPAGVTAPSPTLSLPGGGDAYGSPESVLKNLVNGNLIPGVSGSNAASLLKLLGGGSAGSALSGLLKNVSPELNKAIFGNMTQPQGNYQFPWTNVLSGILGYAGQQNMAKAITEATKYAVDKADPFASQRPMYQGKLADAYNNPSSFLNNPLFTTARDDAINATQRKLSAVGFNGSGNEGLEMTKAGTTASLNQAMPYMDLLSKNAGAQFSPAGAGTTALTGGMAAAAAGNNAMGNLGYAAGSAAAGQQPSILESMFNLPSNKNLQQAISGASF